MGEKKKILQYNINTSNRLLIYGSDEYWANAKFASSSRASETKCNNMEKIFMGISRTQEK